MTAPRRKCTCGASAPGGYGPCICSSTPVPPASPEPERPGGWVDGVGWVALSSDLTSGDDNVATWPEEPGVLGSRFVSPVIVVRWADGTRPAPPSPEARPDTARLRNMLDPYTKSAPFMAEVADWIEIRWQGHHLAFIPADAAEALAAAAEALAAALASTPAPPSGEGV